MEENFELDLLKSKEEEAFHLKQTAFQRYAMVRDRTNMAYNKMRTALEEKCLAREKLNRQYEMMQFSGDSYHKIWEEYTKFHDNTWSRIRELRQDADAEHQVMVECFKRATDEYEFGDKSEASIYSVEGHKHKDRRDMINDEINALINDIDDEEEKTRQRMLEVDNPEFRIAKEIFRSAKARYRDMRIEFLWLKGEREQYWAEFASAQEKHLRLKKELIRKLSELAPINQTTNQKTPS